MPNLQTAYETVEIDTVSTSVAQQVVQAVEISTNVSTSEVAQQNMMDGNDEISNRETTVKGPTNTMMYLKLSTMDFPYVRPIPEDLLAYADHQIECVVSYIRENALTVQLEPVGPYPSATHASVEREGLEPRIEKDQEQGVPDQGEMRENVNVRCDVGVILADSAANANDDAADVDLEIDTADEAVRIYLSLMKYYLHLQMLRQRYTCRILQMMTIMGHMIL
ncbi:hypothetical protein L6452_06496 [Arctium lappa]|uniref:Uncharacterized protein n=1 Tax=Arctium lappa TaxID=4217 RepID=A0ACB9EJZ8_ARCLA|nr:hypothetical protein L6452_06496 [Arctium lappa]